MKKVRFESPVKRVIYKMQEQECHSPRPFDERQLLTNVRDSHSYSKVLTYSNDPIQLFESSDSSPYPSMNKTELNMSEQIPLWSACSDLDLSMLDGINCEPRQPSFHKSILKASQDEKSESAVDATKNVTQCSILSCFENKAIKSPNVLMKDDDFFLKRNNVDKMQVVINSSQHPTNALSLDKPNKPLIQKAQLVQKMTLSDKENRGLLSNGISSYCRCHHCFKNTTTTTDIHKKDHMGHIVNSNPCHMAHNVYQYNNCKCEYTPTFVRCLCCDHIPHHQVTHQISERQTLGEIKLDALDKKRTAIAKYEESKNITSMEVDKQENAIKEKREPTVSDLFKIIRLQNEQLQLLQEKVDKFILNNQQTNNTSTQNCISEDVAIESTGIEHHKISIGVMTSFEMVRTSTIINKEIVKSSENAHIQCNRSQVSLKEVISKSQSPNLKILEGIPHVDRSILEQNGNVLEDNGIQQINEEKTLNELSLYNVQVDNATTPLMSPEQSLYLDIRDYSDSDVENDDQSNVGWTYYNKIMTHVNGVLQDSDMPSSASALYRNTRQHLQSVQMQIDKTNVSVTRRVKFGDDPIGIHQPHLYAASTDTSLKMNQLAAKYLKGALPKLPQLCHATTPVDMSFATRNYMERHKLMQNVPNSSKQNPTVEMPKFLDITALKQQPKLL